MAATKKTWVWRAIALIVFSGFLTILRQTYFQTLPHPNNPSSFHIERSDNQSSARTVKNLTLLNPQTNPSYGQLFRRRPDPTTPWDTAVTIGSWLVCMMNAPMSTITQSKWTQYSSLDSYGWDVSTDEVDLTFYNMNPVWTSLGISTQASAWTSILASHDRPTRHNGREYPSTMGRYGNVYNLQDGVIVCESNYGPDFMNEDNELEIPASQIVPMKQLSDILFLIWTNLHTTSTSKTPSVKNVKNLHHVFRYDVENAGARARMTEVLGRQSPPKTGPPPVWPGLKFSMKDDTAKALMNTSNSAGVAWLLGQHKEQLGIKVVDEVAIFSSTNSGGVHWNMYFHVVDGPLGVGELR